MAEILVVEDDPDLLDVAVMVLRVYDYRVSGAADGDQGFAALLGHAPDLVITDIEMPNLDGPGMVKRMQERGQGLEAIPVILLSGLPDLRQIASKLGTPYFLAKPYEVDVLLGLVEKALKERRPPKPLAG